jgi:hypothetical protein
MEIYVMKKKFVLVLALVLLVATTAAFAGDVNFSGRARAGYVFKFTDSGTAITAKYPTEAKINFVVADADGLWTITYKTIGASAVFGSNEKFGAIGNSERDRVSNQRNNRRHRLFCYRFV